MNDFKIKGLNNQSLTDAAKDAIGNGLKAIGGQEKWQMQMLKSLIH